MTARAVTTEASEATIETTVPVSGLMDPVPVSRIQGSPCAPVIVHCEVYDSLKARGAHAFRAGKGNTVGACERAGIAVFQRSDAESEAVAVALRNAKGAEHTFGPIVDPLHAALTGTVKVPLIGSGDASGRTKQIARQNRAVWLTAVRSLFKKPQEVGCKDSEGDFIGGSITLPGSIPTVAVSPSGVRLGAYRPGAIIAAPSSDWGAEDAPEQQEGMLAYWATRAIPVFESRLNKNDALPGRFADLMGL